MSEILEKMVEAPAVALDKTLETSRQVTETITDKAQLKKAQEYWRTLGPGLTTGAADDDPSGIATYSQSGAQFGFQLLWLAGFTFPLMAIIQEMCARIGMVTGRGLAANIRLNYPRWVIYVCTIFLFIANTFNIGADLGAMAKATQLLMPNLSFWFLVFAFTVVTLGLQIFTTYEKYAKYLKWLALVLLSYVVAAISINMDWGKLLKFTFVPSLTISKEQLLIITGVLGTTISPYLFFWQTSQEVEEQILDGKTSIKLRQEETTNKEIKDMRVDIWSGMFLSNLVMYCIIATCAATLYSAGITNIGTASDAAAALKPIAGDQAYLMFALGIIGTGLLAIPVLTGSASYALSESFGWKNGLYRRLKDAYAFYGVIILSMLIGLGINFIGADPIKTLIYSAVANGLIAPIILVMIVLIGSNKKIMEKRVNHPVITIIGWITVALMSIAGIATIISFF
jgi:NRAMP (natural resistance-associated macrophage protein)-like metal ion transporter